MLPCVVGEDGKIVTEIAKDSKTKITLVKCGEHEDQVLILFLLTLLFLILLVLLLLLQPPLKALFHVVGLPNAIKTAQYIMKIKVKEKIEKGEGGIRYNK